MKSLVNKFIGGVKKGASKTKDFAKRNYNTLTLAGTMALAGAALLSPGKAYSQNTSTNYNTKADQVDTLWGANNSTPDSVAYNVFSRPNIVKTYGKAGDDPTLDWGAMTPTEKAAYFKKTKDETIKVLYKKYDTINNVGDTILYVKNANCSDYNNWSTYVTEGENNIENDPGSSLNWSSDIKQINLSYNGYFNLPNLYVSDYESNGGLHAVSGVYLKDKITQNTTLENDFEIRDSQTNYSAMPGTIFMSNSTTVGNSKNTVTVSWYGYSNGTYKNYEEMAFQFDKNNNSYLIFLNPKTRTIAGRAINSTANIPSSINYSSDWTSKLEKEVTNTTNQDTTATIHTDDGTTKVDISYFIRNKFSYGDTTDLHNASNGTFSIPVTDTIQYVQKGVLYGSPFYPNGRYYYTILKENVEKSTVNVTKSTTGIFNHKANNQKIYPYPNPARNGEVIRFKFPENDFGRKLIQLYDVSGRFLGQKEVDPQNATINTMKYHTKPGMLFMRVVDEKTGKVIETDKEILR